MEVMVNWTVDIDFVKCEDRFEFYLNKFKEKSLGYFYDILNF